MGGHANAVALWQEGLEWAMYTTIGQSVCLSHEQEVPNEILPVSRRELAGDREDGPEASCRSRVAGVCEHHANFI